MRKDFRHHPGEHIVTWMLRCWDNGASTLELESREAKQLGSLARDGGIGKAIGKKAQDQKKRPQPMDLQLAHVFCNDLPLLQ